MFYHFKILFIPCRENDYRPEFLSSKRLLFHGVSAFLIKLLVVIFIVCFPIEAWLTPDIEIQEATKIINKTNHIRQELGVPPLKENYLLDLSAEAKAQDMLANGYFSHTSPQGKKMSEWFIDVKYDYKFVGENLAMGFPSSDAVFNGWLGSPTHYANIVDPDFKEVGIGVAAGPYKDRSTVIVVQHFGSSEKPSDKEFLISDENQPVVDLDRTKIVISDVFEGHKSFIKAEVYLRSEAKKVKIKFNNYQLQLQQDKQDNDLWKAYMTVSKEQRDRILDNVVMASLEIAPLSGQKIVKDIEWNNIIPQEPSFIDQYLFIRLYPSNYVKPFLDLSLWYFSILTIILSSTLLLMIFVNLKKQYPLTILYTICLIVFLGILIIF